MLSSKLEAKLTFSFIEQNDSKELIRMGADAFAMALKAVEVAGKVPKHEAERYAIECLEKAEAKYARMDADTFRELLRWLHD